jgi:hypothetical protein
MQLRHKQQTLPELGFARPMEGVADELRPELLLFCSSVDRLSGREIALAETGAKPHCEPGAGLAAGGAATSETWLHFMKKVIAQPDSSILVVLSCRDNIDVRRRTNNQPHGCMLSRW